jgi:hypothetical protein
MKHVNTIRWTAIGLHTIVMIFGLAIGPLATNFDPLQALAQSKSDPSLERAMLLSVLVVVGNLFGATLLASPLFKSLGGTYSILAYEILFLAATLAFLSVDFSIASGVIVLSLLYVASVRRKAVGAQSMG